MKVVWKMGSATVRDVYETLREGRALAYTTVMTTMNILETKGFLLKEPHGRAFRYRPAQPERRVLTAMVREFVDRVFGGAAEPLVQHLVKDRHLSEEDLREIAKQLKDKS